MILCNVNTSNVKMIKQVMTDVGQVNEMHLNEAPITTCFVKVNL